MSLYCPGAIQVPQPDGVTLDTSLPPRFVWHITWDALDANGHQPAFSAVASYLQGKEYCPHIMWNPFTGYMEQYYPANVGSRALTYNDQDGTACVQVEIFFTPGCVVDGVKYNTVADTPLIGFDTLLAWADSLGIPRDWPMGGPQWSGNARDADVWNANAGHYGHCHSPGDTHTDPGPMPDLNRSTLAPQSSIITPEGFLMALTDAEQRRILAWADRGLFVLDRERAKVLTNEDLPAIADAVLNRDIPWYGFDGKRPTEGRTTTTLAVNTGYSDTTAVGIHGAIGNVPASVLNQSFKLPDGTVTNLAGILTAIHATPVTTVTNVAGAPTDPAVIAAASAAAVLEAIKTQVNK